jgi:hypothetical protein
MKDNLVEERLMQIEARLNAATPAPWQSFIEGRDHTSGSNFIMTNSGKGEDIEMLGATAADQDFVAAAREDIPFLLAEVRRLQALQIVRS